MEDLDGLQVEALEGDFAADVEVSDCDCAERPVEEDAVAVQVAVDQVGLVQENERTQERDDPGFYDLQFLPVDLRQVLPQRAHPETVRDEHDAVLVVAQPAVLDGVDAVLFREAFEALDFVVEFLGVFFVDGLDLYLVPDYLASPVVVDPDVRDVVLLAVADLLASRVLFVRAVLDVFYVALFRGLRPPRLRLEKKGRVFVRKSREFV